MANRTKRFGSLTPQRRTLKNNEQETRLFRRRLFEVAGIVGFLTFLLLIRLGYLQGIAHHRYSTLSRQNIMDLSPLEPNRGLIFARDGTLLADNLPVFSLEVIPAKVHDLEKSLKELRSVLTLSPQEWREFRRELRQHRRYESVPLKLNLSEEDRARFYVDQFRFNGFAVHARLIRHYPFGEDFAHAVGTVGRINQKELETLDKATYQGLNFIGKTGLEHAYESVLRGRVGLDCIETDATGRRIRSLQSVPAASGSHLTLTLDAGLQHAAQAILAQRRGAVVALDPRNGEILAFGQQS